MRQENRNQRTKEKRKEGGDDGKRKGIEGCRKKG